MFAIQDDVTDRIVATIADRAGVLARSMVQAVRDLPLDQLSARELIFRCWRFQWRPALAEHAAERTALERGLEQHPDNPHLLAELANLYISEHSLFFNPRPDPLERAIRVARRAVELDPGGQEGWKMVALASFFRHDETLMREAGDRAIRLNPRNSNALAWIGTSRTHAGDYDEGCQLALRAIALNPGHPGWFHFPLFSRHFVRGEFDDALKAARRANMPDFVWMHFAVAAAAGQLGLAGEARAAADAMLQLSPALADEANLREFVTRWYWPPDLIEGLLEGVVRARGATLSNAVASSRGPAAESASRAQSRSGSTPAATDVRSAPGMRIAVLPFTARGGDDATALAEGLTDDITTGLSRFAHLRVVPAGAAEALTLESAPRAGVRYLLEGRVQGRGDAVRVTVRLIDGTTGANLWADTFDRPLGSTVFEVQDDLGSYIVATIGDTSGVLARAMVASLLQRPVEELSVRELVLRFHAYVEHFQADEHARLRAGLERALGREPHVAEGWACLADLYEHEHSQRLNPLPDSLGRQRRAAERALEIDPHNQRGWTAMAAVHTFGRDRAALRVAVERAIALNPLNADTVGLCALFLSCAGDDDRAMELFARAARLKPQHPGWYHFPPFTTHYKRREYTEALAEAKRINLPQLPTVHISAAAAAARVGSVQEAQAAVEALRRIDARFLEPEAAREAVALWIWDQGYVQDLIDGLAEAIALTGGPSGGEDRDPRGVPASRVGSGDARPGSDVAASRPASGSGPEPGGGTALLVALQPFTARADDADATELARGLTDDVTTGLSRFRYVRVRSIASAGDGQDPRRAGAAAGAGYVLDGAVRRSGSMFRVNARLTAVATGEHLWAEQYDRDASSTLFALQDDLASRIVATLADGGGVLARALAEALREADPDSPSGLLVRWARYAEHFTPGEHAALRDAMEALVARQPGSSTAWAYLSILYGHEIFFDFNPRPDTLTRVRYAAERAVTLDSGNQTAWYALAGVEFFERHRGGLASAAERTMELNPLHSRTLGGIGIFQAFAGDTVRGEALVARAMSLNPRFPGWFHIVPFLDAYRRGDAESAFTNAARINMPHLPVGGRLFAIAAAGRFGREREARDGLRLVGQSRPDLLSADAARREWSRWIWEGELLDALVDGYDSALVLVPGSAEHTPPGADVSRPASGDSMRTAGGSAARPGIEAAMRVAVLPFSGRGGDDASALADGLTDDITTALARFPYLDVVSRTAVGGLRAGVNDARAAGTTLGARFLLEGNVRLATGAVRVSVRLSDVETGAHLWAETFDRDLAAGVFAVQDDVVSRVAATVGDSGGVLVRTIASGVRGRPIESLDTGELVLRYHGDFAEHFSAADHAALRDAFEAAVVRAPATAMAWACLAMIDALEVFFGLNPKANPLARLREAAERANTLDPTIQHGWVAMATAALFDRDRAGLQAATDRALALNPFHTRSLATLGLYAVFAGDTRRGVELMERSTTLNPHHPGWYLLAPFLDAYERGDFLAALGFAKRIGMPKFVAGHLAAAAAAGQVGTREDARPALDALERFDPRLIQPEGAREVWARWIWDAGTVDRLVQGLEKAVALGQEHGGAAGGAGETCRRRRDD